MERINQIVNLKILKSIAIRGKEVTRSEYHFATPEKLMDLSNHRQRLLPAQPKTDTTDLTYTS